MGAIPEVASRILAQSELRVEIAAQNMSNATTPGYKRRLYFQEMLSNAAAPGLAAASDASATDFSAGKLSNTGNPFDLAIEGEGFFQVRDTSDRVLYTRGGQFNRDADGRLVSPAGLVLQAEGGGDLILKGGDLKIAADGMVLEDGEPTARIALAAFDAPGGARAEGGAFALPESQTRAAGRATVRQGMLETSNVTTGSEMISIMEAVRRAEAGQKLVNLYDDLLGRALQTFGQVGS